MLYIVLIILLIAAVILTLRLRLRLLISRQQRLLFVGLGRTGPEFDLATRRGVIRICGLTVKTLTPEDRAKARETPKKKPKKKEKKPSRRQRRPSDILRLVPSVSKAVWGYLISLLRSVSVEYLEGEIDAGFESPDMTGTVFGYYQAAIGVVPSAGRHFRFRPNWDGPAFEGNFRASFALPLYALVWNTVVLVFKLPLRQIIKVAIGRKKGGQSGQ